MKALSIKQPWAWCILHAGKDVENRDWREWNPGLKFRGEFLIHTGKQLVTHEECRVAMSLAERAGKVIPSFNTLHLGGFVGVATLVDVIDPDEPAEVVAARCNIDYFFGPYGLVVKNARVIPFVPALGKLGFFDVEMTPELEQYVKVARIARELNAP